MALQDRFTAERPVPGRRSIPLRKVQVSNTGDIVFFLVGTFSLQLLGDCINMHPTASLVYAFSLP